MTSDDLKHGGATVHPLQSRWKGEGPFAYLADRVAFLTGRPLAFGIAVGMVVVWIISGPFFHHSMAWQMVGGVAPSMLTFLMVFLIQNLQNRDTQALHIKLDELLRATEGAHTSLVGIHQLTEHQLKELSEKYQVVAEHAKRAVLDGQDDTGKPDVEVVIVENQPAV